MEVYSQRERGQRETIVDKALEQLIDAGDGSASRSSVIAIFKDLETCGAGSLIQGRRGRKTRFKWTSSMIEVASAAVADDPDSIVIDEIVESHESDDESGSFTHIFNLRADLEVEFELPQDLTEGEGERLAQFLRALAFR